MGEPVDKEAAPQDYEQRLEALRRRYLAALPALRDELAQAWRGCAGGPDSEAWQRLRDLSHRLSGSAPCYGLDSVGEPARQLDKLLSGRAACRDHAVAAPLAQRLLAALDQAIASNV